METLPWPDELAQRLQFIPVLADTAVEVELHSPQNPVTHQRVEVIPMGHLKWANQVIVTCGDRESSGMKCLRKQ